MSKNQNVIITGSSSGFGFLTTRTLLENGYTVFATMRDLDGKNASRANELRDFADGTTGTLRLLELDVTNDASVETAVRQALDEAGQLDVVINNAGIGAAGFAEGFTVDQFQRIFDVNVFGVQRVNRAVLPAMRERGSGLLIHVSSSLGRLVIPFAAPYTATKYAVEGLSESYRYELAGTGVDVVVVEPGGFGTGFAANMVMPADEVRVESYGELRETPRQMWSGMVQQLQGENAPDPQVVADAILTLIETPAGQRPLRTVVDPMTGGEAASVINQTTDQIQSQLLAAFGMGDLLSVNGGH